LGDIEVGGQKKRVGITRLHLEDDAAKNLHEGFSQSATKGYIDYNARARRSLKSSASRTCVRRMKRTLTDYFAPDFALYGVSDVNMEEGSLRCDANVSVRLRGATEFGTKVEVKT